MKEVQAGQRAIQWTKAADVWVSFGWVCNECRGINYVSYDTWLSQTNFNNENECIEECLQCERGQVITSPF